MTFAAREASADDIAACLNASEELQQVEFFFDELRRNAAFRLPKDQELLAADLGVDGIHAWGRLYDRLSGALRVHVMERGEIVEKSPGQVQFDSPERTVRMNNFFAADKAWKTIDDTCADALNHISGTRLSIYKRLGVQDHLDSPLRWNRMSRETLHAMWQTISDRKSMLLDYLRAKASRLGVEKLSWYDQQAPLPLEDVDTRFDYDRACEMIITCFGQFSDELGSFAKMAIDDRWIEAENRSGKRQGGFCTGFPTKRQSRIFMTYNNTSGQHVDARARARPRVPLVRSS